MKMFHTARRGHLAGVAASQQDNLWKSDIAFVPDSSISLMTRA
jgi:hypothetical protein